MILSFPNKGRLTTRTTMVLTRRVIPKNAAAWLPLFWLQNHDNLIISGMMGWGVGNSLTSGASIVGCVPYHTRPYQTMAIVGPAANLGQKIRCGEDGMASQDSHSHHRHHHLFHHDYDLSLTSPAMEDRQLISNFCRCFQTGNVAWKFSCIQQFS